MIYLAKTEKRITVIDHPLAQTVLTQIRDKDASQIAFRKGLVKLGRIIGYEISKTFPTKPRIVETPLKVKAGGLDIPDMENVIIVTVLRAAMPLSEGLLKIFSAAKQGVISAKRLEDSGKKGREFDVEIYYSRIPDISKDNIIVISDPMLATASTMRRVIDIVCKNGSPKRIILANVIATDLAIKRVLEQDARTEVFTIAVDPELNSKGYIVPGLGDAGDRAFG